MRLGVGWSGNESASLVPAVTTEQHTGNSEHTKRMFLRTTSLLLSGGPCVRQGVNIAVMTGLLAYLDLPGCGSDVLYCLLASSRSQITPSLNAVESSLALGSLGLTGFEKNNSLSALGPRISVSSSAPANSTSKEVLLVPMTQVCSVLKG